MENYGAALTEASARLGSSGILRNSTFDAFARSSREVDDEESIKWAALEKLPTNIRIRRGILSENEGNIREIDLRNLGLVERKNLIERLVKNPQEDNEKFLLNLKDRLQKVGIDLPEIQVRFEHLNVRAEAYVGGRALPTLYNLFVNIVEGFLSCIRILPSRKKPFTMLHDASGIIKPGRMTLLLGPPSSGKTTLLRALSGKLDPKLEVSGKVTYNGHDMNEFVPQRTSAYISQYDLHIPEMTVRETLEFSARCQGVGPRYEMLAELSRREKAAKIKPDPDLDIFMKATSIEEHEVSVSTDYVIKVLGLDRCADTLVGNEMIRGISGGERKRLTTGEMLVGPARALFMDEISSGLDSSTTFQIVNSIKQTVHILQATALVSLLQPAPETYDLFDDILLISSGQIVYQGPRENVLEFFEHTGFKCPKRKGVADFLQEVTSEKDQEQYWSKKEDSYQYVSVTEFSEAFQVFPVGHRLADELETPFDKEKSHPGAIATHKYGISNMELLKACTARELLLMQKNSFVYIFKSVQITVMSAMAMSVFLRVKMHRDTVTDGQIYLGALFYSLLLAMFNGFAELSLSIMKLPVFYKQRDLLFYPAWAYSLPQWIIKIPISMIEMGIWVCVTYYTIGYDPSARRFFKQYLVLLLVNQMAGALFRLMAALGRNMVVAYTFGTCALLSFIALGGFVLSRDQIRKWWIWGYWISPLMYGQNALSVNELLGNKWSHVPRNSTETLGVQVLKSRGIFTDAKWYWIGVGALAGYILIFNILTIFGLAYLNPFGNKQAVLSEESPSERISIREEREDEVPDNVSAKFSMSGRTGSIRDHDPNRKRGMILPFQPLSIVFEDIRYAVDVPQDMKDLGIEGHLEILKGINGAFRPGVLTALMGISGAGKTTLLDVLAGRKTGGYIHGTIKISGYTKKQETFARISGYCEQTDIHSPHVTVYESVLFSAWLRLPVEVDVDTRKMFIEEVMELVELEPLRDTLVGLPGVNGLSTEQRKRLTIAIELVANPSIIFMDEPTSGLDARAAAIVMRTVRNTVDTGRTVVCTIHQPSIDIFDAFDELLLLKRGGEEIYVGPLGRHSCQLIKYFEGITGVSRIKDSYNPATWMLEVTSISQEEALGVNFAQIFKESDLYRRNMAMIKELSVPAPNSTDLYFPTQYSQSFWTQFKACLWKQAWSYWRNPPYSTVKLVYTAFISLMSGTIFWSLGSKRGTVQDVLNAVGSMYGAVLFLGIQNSMSIQPVVAVERTVFYRERAAGLYSALPYAFGQVVVELPYLFMQTILYCVIVYAMIGFEWTAGKFLWYIFFTYFTLLYFALYGMMAVAVTPNVNIASIISTIFYGLWNLFSGFIIPKTRIPIWWRWFYYICPFAWTLNGLITSQFGDVETRLDTGETVAEFIHSFFGFRYDLLGYVALIIAGIPILFCIVFALSIKAFNFQKR